MSTTVAYHAEYNGTAHPAINVKVHVNGYDFWPVSWAANPPGTSDRDAIVSAAYDRVQSDFWQAAEQIATERGLGEIAQEGRSGGWLVFTSFDPQDHPAEDAESDDEQDRTVEVWLAGYRAMSDWAADWIADAPRKVRELAQSMAMDEAGEGAARRMFATVR